MCTPVWIECPTSSGLLFSGIEKRIPCKPMHADLDCPPHKKKVEDTPPRCAHTFGTDMDLLWVQMNFKWWLLLVISIAFGLVGHITCSQWSTNFYFIFSAYFIPQQQ